MNRVTCCMGYCLKTLQFLLITFFWLKKLLSIPVWGENITLTSYYGSLKPRTYYITESYNMSAEVLSRVCQERGYKLLIATGASSQRKYVREELLRHQNWSSSDHIWVPAIRFRYVSNDWFEAVSCAVKNINIQDSYAIGNQEECSIFNMTNTNKDNPVMTSSCDEQLPLTCFEDIKNSNSTLEEFYNMTIVPVDNLIMKTGVNFTYEECREYSFVKRRNIVSRFVGLTNDTSECFYGRISDFVDSATFTLIEDDVYSNSTVFFKNMDEKYPTRVVVDKRAPLQINDTTLPCLPVISTTITESKSSVISAEDILSTSVPTTCCECVRSTQNNKSAEEIQKEIKEIRANLTVEKKELSSYKRTKISAPDDRRSSAAIGSLGAALLVIMLGTIVIVDLPQIRKGLKQIWRNISNRS